MRNRGVRGADSARTRRLEPSRVRAPSLVSPRTDTTLPREVPRAEPGNLETTSERTTVMEVKEPNCFQHCPRGANEVAAPSHGKTQKRVSVREQSCQTSFCAMCCCKHGGQAESGDPPLLQQQLSLSKPGIMQIVECFRSGTPQLQRMLFREVDTIFECRLCRSLFRGLPNLVTHRQFYCFPTSTGCEENTVKDIATTREQPRDPLINFDAIQSNPNAVFQKIVKLSRGDSLGSVKAGQASVVNQVHTAERASLEALILGMQADTANGTATATKTALADLGTAAAIPQPSCQPQPPKSSSQRGKFGCHICSRIFEFRRNLRRHLHLVHKCQPEKLSSTARAEVQKPQEKAIPVSTLSTAVTSSTPSVTVPACPTVKASPCPSNNNRYCPVCNKAFAYKANARKHLAEMHPGYSLDAAVTSKEKTPDAVRAGNSTSMNDSNSAGSSVSTDDAKLSTSAVTSPSLTTCTLCKRQYNSELGLARHMRLFHKQLTIKEEEVISCNGASSCHLPEPPMKKKAVKAHCTKVSPPPPCPTLPATRPRNASTSRISCCRQHLPTKKSGLSKKTSKMGTKARKTSVTTPTSEVPALGKMKGKYARVFDLRMLFCKLCKRRFSSRHNMRKHIAVHTDSEGLFVKFYCCPTCPYESRRKSDVIRHLTIVHRLTGTCLKRAVAALEGRTYRKSIDAFLNRVIRRGRHPRAMVECGVEGAPLKMEPPSFPPAAIGELTSTSSMHRCSKCDAVFMKKSNLWKHERVHCSPSTFTLSSASTSTSSTPLRSRLSYPCRNTRSKAGCLDK
uniref:zinc finger protein 800-like isoform X2 n=2 Tax=Myxine glutinosa TaxID=7769 RepID=UPI00358E2CB8